MAIQVSGEIVYRQVQQYLASAVQLPDFYANVAGKGAQLRDFMSLPVDVYDEVAADRRNLPGVVETPLGELYSPCDGVRKFVKDETKQPTRAFKTRGAFVAGALAMQETAIQRLVTYSAGNHGAAVAQFAEWYSRRMGVPLTAEVFCVAGLTGVKARRVRSFGAKLHQYKEGDVAERDPHRSLEDARNSAQNLAQQAGAHLMEPFDDPAVMCGQGTALLETVAQLNQRGVDTSAHRLRYFVGGGGFGLANGSAVVLRSLIDAGLVLPNSEVVAVQMEHCDAQRRALEYQPGAVDYRTLFMHDGRDTFDSSVDGTAVREPGPRSLALSRWLQQCDLLRIMTVTKPEVGKAMEDAFKHGIVLEPAGALAGAGAGKDEGWRVRYRVAEEEMGDPELVVQVASGGNVSDGTRARFRRAAAEFGGGNRVLSGVTSSRGSLARAY